MDLGLTALYIRKHLLGWGALPLPETQLLPDAHYAQELRVASPEFGQCANLGYWCSHHNFGGHLLLEGMARLLPP